MRPPPEKSAEKNANAPASSSDVPQSIERRISPAVEANVSDSEACDTPVSGVPVARRAAWVDERVPRATLEVNANVDLDDESSAPGWDEPTPRALSARTTRVLGSSAPPMLAPGSRRVSSSGVPEASSRPATRYRYVSTPPPAGTPSSGMRANPLLAAQQQRPTLRKPLDARELASTKAPIVAKRLPRDWRPDLSLLPESRRALTDELYPLAVDGCWVVGVLATEGAEGRSRLAAEIALALAESGHPRVLLIDADFEHALVRRFLRMEMPLSTSFSEQLSARTPQRWMVVECLPSLHVLAESGHATHASLACSAFVGCVTSLRSYYDFIVLDGPLLDDAVGCEAVRDVVDGVVFSHGRYGPSEIRRVESLFPKKRISLVPAVG
ncbi:MAG: hypothetical protein ACOY0T_17835 [Myxococcota bacterium]